LSFIFHNNHHGLFIVLRFELSPLRGALLPLLSLFLSVFFPPHLKEVTAHPKVWLSFLPFVPLFGVQKRFCQKEGVDREALIALIQISKKAQFIMTLS
jgi:hypothetical protein